MNNQKNEVESLMQERRRYFMQAQKKVNQTIFMGWCVFFFLLIIFTITAIKAYISLSERGLI